MGFKQSELTPPGVISTITPASHYVQCKAFQVNATAAATATYAWLPANASIIGAKVVVKTACDGTNTSISVGAAGVTNSIFSGATLTQATVINVSLATDVLDVEGNQPGSDIKITAELAGAASTTGHAIVLLEYVM